MADASVRIVESILVKKFSLDVNRLSRDVVVKGREGPSPDRPDQCKRPDSMMMPRMFLNDGPNWHSRTRPSPPVPSAANAFGCARQSLSTSQRATRGGSDEA